MHPKQNEVRPDSGLVRSLIKEADGHPGYDTGEPRKHPAHCREARRSADSTRLSYLEQADRLTDRTRDGARHSPGLGAWKVLFTGDSLGLGR